MMPGAVREGNIHYGERMSQNYYEKVGDFKLGNPLRQFQDEIITAVTLCARAAIEGGIPREKALTMSDSYIREVEEAMTVAEVAAGTGDLAYYVSRLFQKEMYQSLPGYFQKNKMEYAAHLLKHSKRTVMDIAESLHYSSTSYFCAKFREEMGMTPTQYRVGNVQTRVNHLG